MFSLWRRRKAKNELIYAALDFHRANFNRHADKYDASEEFANAVDRYLDCARPSTLRFWVRRATEKDHDIERQGRRTGDDSRVAKPDRKMEPQNSAAGSRRNEAKDRNGSGLIAVRFIDGSCVVVPGP